MRKEFLLKFDVFCSDTDDLIYEFSMSKYCDSNRDMYITEVSDFSFTVERTNTVEDMYKFSKSSIFWWILLNEYLQLYYAFY